MDVKQELREFAKGKRRTLDIGLISEEIVNNIRCSEVYRNSKEVMIFYPLANEVNLLGLLEDEKNFYLADGKVFIKSYGFLDKVGYLFFAGGALLVAVCLKKRGKFDLELLYHLDSILI